MQKLILTIGSVVALMLGGIASAATASAAEAPTVGQLKVWRVGTDAMGTDSVANRNREFVTLKNVSGQTLDIANVLVEDNWAHSRTVSGHGHSCNTYKITDLPDNSTTELANGEYVTVFNGSRVGGNHKVNNEYRLYANSDVDCGTAGQFYNNDADTVWVTTSAGVVISKKSWDWGGGYSVFGADQLP